MIGFAIAANDRRIRTVGVGADGVVSLNVMWMGRPNEPDYLWLDISGLDCRAYENVRWLAPKLKVGDTISIKIVETSAVDPPTTRTKAKLPARDEKDSTAKNKRRVNKEREARTRNRKTAKREQMRGAELICHDKRPLASNKCHRRGSAANKSLNLTGPAFGASRYTARQPARQVSLVVGGRVS